MDVVAGMKKTNDKIRTLKKLDAKIFCFVTVTWLISLGTMDITTAQSSFKNKFIESAVTECTFMFCINALVKPYPKRSVYMYIY